MSGSVSWWRLGLGLIWLGVAGWSWATRTDVLVAGHPAQALALTLAGVVGLVLLASAWRDPGARGEGMRQDRTSALPRRRTRRLLRYAVRTLGLVVSVVVLGSLVYLRPFPASEEAASLTEGTAAVEVSDRWTRITLTPTEGAPTSGLVFQPGARVDPRAYLPLLTDVAAQGHLVVIVKQPFGLGFTAVGAPAGVIEDHPGVAAWAVGGHSLGGVAAAGYAGSADGPGQVAGLLLWASYPLESLADRSDLAVTSVSGSADGLATPDDIAASRPDLPPTTTFVEVEGAVHAFFGDYGVQPGDGTPGIGRGAAQEQIAAPSIALLASLPED